MADVVKRDVSYDDLTYFIDKIVECEDGQTRRVLDIVNSYQHPWLFIINEKASRNGLGYPVHVLTLMRQMHGEPKPSVEEKQAFTRLAKRLKPTNLGKIHEGVSKGNLKIEMD